MDTIINTPLGSTFPPPGGHVRLTSPQYGPAWVADCYGSDHEERLLALSISGEGESGVSFSEEDLVMLQADPDQCAIQYALVLGDTVGISLTDSQDDWFPESYVECPTCGTATDWHEPSCLRLVFNDDGIPSLTTPTEREPS
jgi:hypothetical protein